MGRLLLISNRLPVTITRKDNVLNYVTSVGGLVTGINDYLEYINKNPQKEHINKHLWIGWQAVLSTHLIKNQYIKNY